MLSFIPTNKTVHNSMTHCVMGCFFLFFLIFFPVSLFLCNWHCLSLLSSFYTCLSVSCLLFLAIFSSINSQQRILDSFVMIVAIFTITFYHCIVVLLPQDLTECIDFYVNIYWHCLLWMCMCFQRYKTLFNLTRVIVTFSLTIVTWDATKQIE